MKRRNSNMEILRIISIFLIVISHYTVHGIGDTSHLDIGLNRFFLEFITLGNVGSILFVMISGYYLIESNKIMIKKLILLILQVFFYSVIIYLLLVLFNKEDFSIINVIKSCFPISFKMYWFATVYIVLYLFHPFINKYLNSITRKEHLYFIVLMFIVFSLLKTITTNDYYGNELIQFLMFYSIGAYLYKYPNNKLGIKNNNIKIIIISIISITLSIIILDLLGNIKLEFGSNSRYLLKRSSPLIIIFCLGLFDFFSRKKEFDNKIINKIGTLVFGVYLISDNKFIRPLLWNDIFNNIKYVDSSYLLLHIIYATGLTIIMCLIIEFVRKNIIEKNLLRLINKKIDLLQNIIDKKIYTKNQD